MWIYNNGTNDEYDIYKNIGKYKSFSKRINNWTYAASKKYSWYHYIFVLLNDTKCCYRIWLWEQYGKSFSEYNRYCYRYQHN